MPKGDNLGVPIKHMLHQRLKRPSMVSPPSCMSHVRPLPCVIPSIAAALSCWNRKFCLIVSDTHLSSLSWTFPPTWRCTWSVSLSGTKIEGHDKITDDSNGNVDTDVDLIFLNSMGNIPCPDVSVMDTEHAFVRKALSVSLQNSV
jgi:hypothetical protein